MYQMLYCYQKLMHGAVRVIFTIVLTASACPVLAQGGVEIRRNQVGCSPEQEKVILENSINAAFTSDSVKAELRKTIFG